MSFHRQGFPHLRPIDKLPVGLPRAPQILGPSQACGVGAATALEGRPRGAPWLTLAPRWCRCSPTTGSAPSGGWGQRGRRLCPESPQPLEISHHSLSLDPLQSTNPGPLHPVTQDRAANEAVWLTHCQGASSGRARTHTWIFLTPSPEPFPLAPKTQCPSFLPFFREP